MASPVRPTGPFRRFARRFARCREGAVSVLTAGTLLVLLGLFSLAIDFGMAHVEKRRLQGAVDIAALSAALSPADPETAALQAFSDNFDASILYAPPSVTPGRYPPAGVAPADLATLPVEDRFATGGGGANAFRVEAAAPSEPLLASIFYGGELPVTASGTAVNERLVQLVAGSGVVSLSSQDSLVLDALLGSLLGADIALDAVGYEALATTRVGLLKVVEGLSGDIALDALALATLLDGDVTLDDLLGAAIDTAGALDPTGETEIAIQALQTLRTLVLDVPAIRLGDLVDLAMLQPGRASKATVDLLSLVRTSAELANFQHGLTSATEIGLPGLVSASLSATVIEPPQLSAIGGVGISVSTAQTRVNLSLSALGSSILGAVVKVTLPLTLEVGGGTATVTAIDCAGVESVSVDATTGIARLRLEDSDGSEAEIVSILAGLVTVTQPPIVAADAADSATALAFGPPFDATNFQRVSTADPLSNAVAGILPALSLDVEIIGLPLLSTGAVLGVVTPVLGDLLATVDGAVLGPLLAALGTEVGFMDVGAPYLRCDNVYLVN